MSPSAKKLVLLSTSLLAVSWLASAPVRADDIGGKNPPKRVVTNKYQVKPRSVAIAKLDCSPVIYEYGGKTETKTVCSPPWSGPATAAESGPTGSSSSTTQ